MFARGLTALAVALVAIAASAVTGAASNAGDGQARASARSAIQATGREFRITLSKKTVKPGSLRVEFVNFGEDDHDLAITRNGSSYTRTMNEIRPKERDVAVFNVRRGSYVFWCTIDNHKGLGMRATLRVKK